MRLGALGLAVALGACVVRDPAVNYGYAYPSGYGYGGRPSIGDGSVGTPTPHQVTSQAPEPLDEQRPYSPGAGYAWIDGHWHWSGVDWVWVAGRWERAHAGYVYVPPSYDYSGVRYVYTPGYWATRHRVPAPAARSGSRHRR